MVYYTALPQTPWMDPVAKAFNHILESEPVLKVHPREAFWSMCLMVFEGHRYPITSLAFSPDEKKIVSGSSDGTIRIWDVISGSTIGLPMGIAGIRDGINSVAWSPDGKMIAAGYDGAVVRLWSADSGNMVCAPLEGHSDFVTTVVFSSNGSKIASASLDETIRIWAILSNTPNCISIVEVGDVIVILTFSSDDESLLYACQNAGVKRWSMSQGRILDEYPYPDGSPDARSVAFSHDGSKAAVAFAYISTPHLLDVVTCIWSTFEGPSQSSPGEMIGASAVAFSRDGRYLVSGHDDAGIQIWDLAAMAMREHILKGHTSFVTCVACGDLYFVSGSYDYTIRLWAPPLAPVLFSEPEILSPSLVASIAHSPDGTKLVSGLFDGSLQFWDAATGATLSKTQKEHTSVVSCVAFSADGTRVVSGSFDKNLCLWEVSSCSKIGTAFVGHTRSVWSAVFSLDGTLIASGSSDAAVRLWDPASSTSIGSPFLGHSSTVFSVLFSLDGSQIISSSRDQSIRVWTIEPHTEVVHARFLHADSAYFLTRSLDSKYVISISADGTVVCWDAESQTHQPPGADVLLGQKLVVDFRHGWVKDMYGKVWGWLPSQFRGTAFRAIAACGHRLVVSDGKGGLTTFDFSKVISE
jgi:WD40 repeat protein